MATILKMSVIGGASFITRGIPKDLHRAFKRACVGDSNVSMNEVVIELMQEYVRRRDSGDFEIGERPFDHS